MRSACLIVFNWHQEILQLFFFFFYNFPSILQKPLMVISLVLRVLTEPVVLCGISLAVCYGCTIETITQACVCR